MLPSCASAGSTYDRHAPPGLPFEAAARTFYDLYGDQFNADLLDEANEVARRAGSAQIAVEHVATARENAYARHRPRFSWRELLLVLGAALLGAGLENGATEALAGRYGGTFALWVLAATAGAVIVILALAFL